jgi:hypothetical protein
MVENSGSGAASEDRIAALEKKVDEIETLVKGLMQEYMDLKAIVMKMPKQTEKRSLHELKHLQTIVLGAHASSAVAAGGTISHQQGESRVIVRAGANAEDADSQVLDEPAMNVVMHTDRTNKLEPRRGDKNSIVTSADYGSNKKRNSVKSKLSDFNK